MQFNYFYECKECSNTFGKVRRRGQTEFCPSCLAKQALRRWKAAHPEKVKANSLLYDRDKKRARERERASTDAGRADAAARGAKYRANLGEDYRVYKRAYYLANRDKEINRVIQRSKRVKTATPSWADKTAIDLIYNECRRVTEETGVLHHVDHIIPLNGDTVCGLHVETNLQILTAADNQSKNNKLMC
jgi:hypothetical protein